MTEDKEIIWQDMLALTRRVIAAFDRVEQRPWSVETDVVELAKQVGDLARHVMMAERYYLPDRSPDPRYGADRDVIGDELADILYCLIRIADRYEIDLAQAHLKARRAELSYLHRNAEEAM